MARASIALVDCVGKTFKNFPRRPLAALGGVLALALCACGNADRQAQVAASVAARPTAVPAATGPVRTAIALTVLDDGGGPELCTAVAESFPPQCSGTPLTNWNWTEHPEHEAASGKRWGDFAVTGTFDGSTLTVTDAIPAAVYTSIAQPTPDFSTPCEPQGRWTVIDDATAQARSTATASGDDPNPLGAARESLEPSMQTAHDLPGFAGTWLDSHTDPVVLNVAVTHDLAGAEATLRQTWPGELCVSQARYTDTEQASLQEQVSALPGMVMASAHLDVVTVIVLHDDGSLQAWADQTYGTGRVTISSALVAAD